MVVNSHFKYLKLLLEYDYFNLSQKMTFNIFAFFGILLFAIIAESGNHYRGLF